MSKEKRGPYWDSELDQQLGSIIEGWTCRDTGEYCRFCAVERVGDVPPIEKYCSDECEERFNKVMAARLAVGKRDLEQRGYD
jgi:hypothetical protein